MGKNYEPFSEAHFFDVDYFRILCGPVRSDLLVYLVANGAQSISDIAENFKQDRSVISRHLEQMHQQGILEKKKESRSMIYTVNAREILKAFEKTTAQMQEMIERYNL